MKIAVIGGTGLIGKKLVNRLSAAGHDVLAASPATGVNTITGEGLEEALSKTDTVVDVTNPPFFKGESALEFFETSGHNLLAAAAKAGVKHYLVLSIVGTERLQQSDYFQAKQVQENLVRGSGIPYTIVHSTQFFEFVGAIARAGVEGENYRIPKAFIQPIAADDLVDELAAIVLDKPANGMVEVAGPQKFRMDELVRQYLAGIQDERMVIADAGAAYFGAVLNDASLIPGEGARLGTTRFEEWISQPENQRLFK